MQDFTQNALQPFTKLAQNNMALFTQFCTSPEIVARTMSNAQSLLQQGQASGTDLSQSNAVGQLIQGMLKNYTEFLAELGQSGVAMLAQGQAAMVARTEDAVETVASHNARGGRARRAA
jgi:hypothetical protein